MEKRKSDHIELAFQSKTPLKERDSRFYYEPLLAPHPSGIKMPVTFSDKKLNVPVWVSSMTGGTALARKINTNLAMACKEFGMGMGLGSCRIILNHNSHFEDFNMRDIIGESLPLFANLGINQVEEAVVKNETPKIYDLVKKLRADGLVIHINPLQEWFQPEGDRLKNSPIDTIKRFIEKADFKIIVKEVGQGMGPESLSALLKLPLTAIEFAAFGGTNFAKLELIRSKEILTDQYIPFAFVGEDAESMVNYVNAIIKEEGKDILCKSIIISGGIKNYLDGFYLINKIKMPAIYGMASEFLKHAKESYEDLQKFVNSQIKGLSLAQAYLKVK